MTTPPYKRNLHLLLTGRFVSSVMTHMFVFASGLYVMDITGSAGAFSALIIASLAPRAIFNFFAGIIVDRFPVRKLIIGCDLAATLAVALFLCWLWADPNNYLIFVLLSFLLSGINTLFIIAVQTATPRIVGEKLVVTANAIQQSMKSLALIFGPMLGALLYRYTSMETIFIVNAASFLISAGFECLLRFPARETSENQSLAKHLGQIISYFKQEPALRDLFITAIAMQLFFEPMLSLLLPFVTYKILFVSEVQLSFIQAAASLGVIAAAAILSRKGGKKAWLSRFIPLLIIQGFLFVLWSFPTFFSGAGVWTLTAVFALLQILGRFFNTLQVVPLLSHFQITIPEEIRGRVFGLFYALTYMVVPISVWVYGVLLKQMAWWQLPLITGGVIILIAAWVGLRPDLKALLNTHK